MSVSQKLNTRREKHAKRYSLGKANASHPFKQSAVAIFRDLPSHYSIESIGLFLRLNFQ